jgi:hypothetical protein
MWTNKESIWRIGYVVGAGLVFTVLAFLASPNHMQVQGAINEPSFERIVTNPIWYLGAWPHRHIGFLPLPLKMNLRRLK